MRRWITLPEARSFRDTFAWRPVRAVDEYTKREAWVWLTSIRVHDDGRVTFSSFWI
jgi:hypothetical protein